MIDLSPLYTGPLGHAIAWALVHSVWQASLIAGIVLCAGTILIRRSASFRYTVASVGLLITFVLPFATAVHLYRSQISHPPLDIISLSAPAAAETDPARLPDHPDTALQATPFLPSVAQLRIEPLLPWVVLFWLAGVLFFASRTGLGWMQLRKISRDVIEADDRWEVTIRRLSRRMRLDQTVRLVHSRRVDVPAVIGWISPVILMPFNAVSGLEPRQIETILAHELAHVRRHDYLVNLLQTAVETIFFYHPAVWWMSRQVRIERELCCDDIAVQICGDAVGYARALTRLEELRADVHITALAATGGSLLNRIRRLIGRGPGRERLAPPVFSGAVLVVTLVMATVLFAAPERASEDSPAPAPAPAVRSDYSMTVVSSEDATDPRPDDVDPADGWEMPEPPEPPEAPEPPDPDFDFDLDSGLPAMAPLPEMPEMPEMPAIPPMPMMGTAAIAPMPPMPVMPVMPGAPAPAPRVSAAGGGSRRAGHAAPMIAMLLSAEGEEPLDPRHLDVDTLVRLRASGVDADYVRALRAAGFDHLSLNQIIRLAGVGVTPDFIASMRAAFGPDLSAEDMIRLRGVGVSPDWLAKLRSAGYTDLSAEDAVRAKGVGIDPEFAASMRSAFGTRFKINELVRLRGVGVTPDYVAAIRAAGYDQASANDIVRLRGVGVDVAYLHALQASGIRDLAIEDLVRLRGVGVDPEYIAAMKSLGLGSLGKEDLVRLRGVGVDPAWVAEIRAAGLADLSTEDLIRLRGVGVDADYIRELASAGYDHLSVEQLIRLRSSGVDAAFIRNLRQQ